MADEVMAVEQWWNNTDRRKSEYQGTDLSKYLFVHHKSHMDLYEPCS